MFECMPGLLVEREGFREERFSKEFGPLARRGRACHGHAGRKMAGVRPGEDEAGDDRWRWSDINDNNLLYWITGHLGSLYLLWAPQLLGMATM